MISKALRRGNSVVDVDAPLGRGIEVGGGPATRVCCRPRSADEGWYEGMKAAPGCDVAGGPACGRFCNCLGPYGLG